MKSPPGGHTRVLHAHRYRELSKEDLIGAGMSEPAADLQIQMYTCSIEFGCAELTGPAWTTHDQGSEPVLGSVPRSTAQNSTG